MKCPIYRILCLRKSETEFEIRLNNHRKGVNRQNTPEVDQ